MTAMPKRSVHDNKVLSYEVDGEHRRIVLHTRFDAANQLENTDVVFEGVIAYKFQGDNFGNVLLGIDEAPVSKIVEEDRVLFEEGSKYAWPGPWNDSFRACLAYFQSKAAKGYEISSSYGLCGWIIAESCSFEAKGIPR
jgi:hypothetical protein